MIRLTYAVGDIHGREDLLVKAVAAVKEHAELNGAEIELIFLGDYVDRGPDSAKAIELLRLLEDTMGVRCLRGNHEDLMIKAYDSGEHALWMMNGGLAALASYKLHPGGVYQMADDVDWLRTLAYVHQDEHRIYVHAGLMPGHEVAAQTPEQMTWIRERFLRAKPGPEWAGKHVVHGHTPQWDGKPDASKPELLDHRTNLDTGAFHTGVLTVGVFDPAKPGGPVDLIRVTA